MSALGGDGNTILVLRGCYSDAGKEGDWDGATLRTAIPALLGSGDRHIGPTPLMIPTKIDAKRSGGRMLKGCAIHWMEPNPGKIRVGGRFNYMQELRFSLSLEELERVTELRIELLWPEKCCANVH
jgi:hypothetical protein